MVLSFWATWCGPCIELGPKFQQSGGEELQAEIPDVAFLAVSTEDDEAQVPLFIAREKWDVPVVFADGLDSFMKVPKRCRPFWFSAAMEKLFTAQAAPHWMAFRVAHGRDSDRARPPSLIGRFKTQEMRPALSALKGS